jgi:hypothetical protein
MSDNRINTAKRNIKALYILNLFDGTVVTYNALKEAEPLTGCVNDVSSGPSESRLWIFLSPSFEDIEFLTKRLWEGYAPDNIVIVQPLDLTFGQTRNWEYSDLRGKALIRIISALRFPR